MDSSFGRCLYSETARKTDPEIRDLRRVVGVPIGDEKKGLSKSRGSRGALKPSALAERGATQKRPTSASGTKMQELSSPEVEKPMQTGDLARAIQEKLGKKLGISYVAEPPEESPTEANHQQPKPKLAMPTRPFAEGNFDGPWASRMTASVSKGALNRWNEQRPDPCWYRPHYDAQWRKEAVADFNERPKHRPRSADAEKGDNGGTFVLTCVDVEEEKDPPRAQTKRELQNESCVPRSLSTVQPTGSSRPKSAGQPTSYLSRARGHSAADLKASFNIAVVTYQSVSEPAEDALQQDMKGYPSMRPPEWDFGRSLGRPDAKSGDDSSAPGQYHVKWDAVDNKIRTGVAFQQALTWSQSEGQLGHFAPGAILQPDEKRYQAGGVPDRSFTRDALRHRALNVNDFDRELPRPPAQPAAFEYHDKDDPEACAITLHNQMTYNADVADVSVTNRRDVAPGYEHMLSRGKAAIQGLRSTQSDLVVRGSLGMGFVAIEAPLSAEKADGNGWNSAYERKDLAPKFEQYTQYKPLSVATNWFGGHSNIQGAGNCQQQAPLQKKPVGAHFRRRDAPGFTVKVNAGGRKVAPQSRIHEAVADWADHVGGQVHVKSN